ncbi:MAG: cytochrome c biogenesis protein ResB [Planctomycetota bacterium]
MTTQDLDRSMPEGALAQSAAPDAAAAPKQARGAAGGRNPLMTVLSVFGSMKFAVVLFLLLGLLTWLGTLAQIGDGLWKTQKEYFESWWLIAKLPLSIWNTPLFPDEAGKPFELAIPLPGAYPVMALLFVNLMVGGLLRMRWRIRNVGVLVVHLGMALLLVAGFVKMEYSYSGSLALYEPGPGGQQVADRQHEAATFVSFHDHELALLIDKGETVVERVVPEQTLLGAADGTVTLRAEGLPFRVELRYWMDNCRVLPKGPMFRAPTPVLEVDGSQMFLRPEKVQDQRSSNVAGCYATVLTDDNERIETMLVSSPFRLPMDRRRFPFAFEVGGQRYGLDLRRVVYDLPFSVRLDRFVKRDHPGTTTPADFRSFVKVDDNGVEREAQVYMNTPLRKDGYVVYQTSWGPASPEGRPLGPPWYSVFEVAENPSDKWPEYACWVIALGLLMHFIPKLMRFLNSSGREALIS